MAITPPTIKKLFALSGNLCAFPDCHQMLVQDSTLIGEICHIESNKPHGPRHNINQSEVERNGIENLLILCPTHHALIDSNVGTFTVEVLKKMKHEHENKHRKDPYKPRTNIIKKALKQEKTQNIGVIHGNVSNSPINIGTGTQSITYINHPTNGTFTSNDNPDVVILVVGQEHSYYFDQLQKVSPNKALIKIEPIKVPDGENHLPEIELPLQFFNWAHPPNYKLYTIAVNNRGEGIGKNVKVDIDFTPCIIQKINIKHPDRVSVIMGGETGSRIAFKLNEVLPGETQSVELLINCKTINSCSAWSENQGTIEKIYIADVRIGPTRK